MIRVVLADDQLIVRSGVERILGPEDGFDVVAQCADGGEALTAAAELKPDLMLMDVRMPRLDGVEATRRLTGAPSPPPVLILTTFDEDELLWSALQAGAAGFVLKDASADDLIAAARTVARGGAWFDPTVAPRLLAACRTTLPALRGAAKHLSTLTDRENDVLRLMARGASNAEIALSLHVSEATVKSHVGAIFTKLPVRDRPAAIVFAFDHEVVWPGDGSRLLPQ